MCRNNAAFFFVPGLITEVSSVLFGVRKKTVLQFSDL